MKISFLGHACFLIESSNRTTIITDPYEPDSYSGAVKYESINFNPDIVTVSHNHFDHNYTKEMKNSHIVDKEGVFKIKDIRVEGILSFHDNQRGSLRGKNIIFIFDIDNLRLVHFGDLGTDNIDYNKLKDLDIVLIPVGGFFTIDAKIATEIIKKIRPKITIPMHYKTPKLDFDIDTVDKFLELNKNFQREKILEVNNSNISSFKEIVVLDYLR